MAENSAMGINLAAAALSTARAANACDKKSQTAHLSSDNHMQPRTTTHFHLQPTHRVFVATAMATAWALCRQAVVRTPARNVYAAFQMLRVGKRTGLTFTTCLEQRANYCEVGGLRGRHIGHETVGVQIDVEFEVCGWCWVEGGA